MDGKREQRRGFFLSVLINFELNKAGFNFGVLTERPRQRANLIGFHDIYKLQFSSFTKSAVREFGIGKPRVYVN